MLAILAAAAEVNVARLTDSHGCLLCGLGPQNDFKGSLSFSSKVEAQRAVLNANVGQHKISFQALFPTKNTSLVNTSYSSVSAAAVYIFFLWT